MSSKYAPDFYFFFITLTLFTLGFLAPIDKRTHPDYFLKKQYENKCLGNIQPLLSNKDTNKKIPFDRLNLI